MKLAELLNVDTTKENWFKLLSKKGINPKTVNAVSKGGENSGEGGTWLKVKNWGKHNNLILMPYITNYYVVQGNGYVGIDVMTIPFSGNYTQPNDFKGIVGIHIAPTILIMNSGNNKFATYIKNIEDYFNFVELMGGSFTEIKDMIYDIFEISTQEEIFNHYKEEFGI